MEILKGRSEVEIKPTTSWKKFVPSKNMNTEW